MKSCALLGAAVFITSSASATVTGLSVEFVNTVAGRDIYSVYVLSNSTNDVILNMIGHHVTAGSMANVRHNDNITTAYGDGYGHWNASQNSASTAATSNQWKDSYVTITGKVGLNAGTALDPGWGSGSGATDPTSGPGIPAGFPGSPANGGPGWYTSNPAVDILITGGKIKVMQIAVLATANHDFEYTGQMSVGYKLQGTTSPLYSYNNSYTIGAAVPAPGALALLGFAGLCSRRRRA